MAISATNAMRLVFFVIGLYITESQALKDLRVKAPEVVKKGANVTLTCDYDLEGVPLYSIRWYRYEVEFYRYLPKESPPTKVFPVKHVEVDLFRSNSRDVTLIHVEMVTAGAFKCEVTSDAPLFHTLIGFMKVLVVDVPDEDPVLRTDMQKVSPGAIIKANCTTPSSYPQMNVTWFINGAEVVPKPNVQTQKIVLHYDALPGTETVYSSLTVRATQDLFKNNKIRLKCLATLFSMYRRFQEVELQEYPAQLAMIMVTTETNMKGGSYSNHSMPRMLLGLAYVAIWLRVNVFL